MTIRGGIRRLDRPLFEVDYIIQRENDIIPVEEAEE